MLVKAASTSLAEQLAERFAERIHTRLLAPGTRLPSVRQCAQQQGVSPSTVVAAYDRLLAQGLVEAHKNRGFFVRNRALVHVDKTPLAIHSVAKEGAVAAAKTSFEAQHVPVSATASSLSPSRARRRISALSMSCSSRRCSSLRTMLSIQKKQAMRWPCVTGRTWCTLVPG